MKKIGFLQSYAKENTSSKGKTPYKTEYCKNATIFGKNTFLPVNMEKQFNDNTLVVGTSGTGKTYSFVEPNILQGNANYIIADAKGDILRDIGYSLKNMGYQIKVLNLVDLKHSMTYNPLIYANNQLDIMKLADEMLSTDITGADSSKTSKQDPYWNNAAESLLQALLLFVKEFLPAKKQTINSVIALYNILDLPPQKINEALVQLKQGKLDSEYQLTSNEDEDQARIGNELFAWAQQQYPRSQAVKMWNSIASTQTAERAWASITSIVGSMLTRYEAQDVVNLMSGNQINFEDLLKPKTALFILYDDADPSKNFISNILYDQLFNFLYNSARKFNNKLPVKVRFFLDDFKNMTIPNFDNYLATARSRNISICIMVQDESQLRAKFGVATPSVIGDCSAYLLTGTTDLTMASIASNRFNTTSTAIRLKDINHFLLDVGGHIAHPVRFDFHDHPRYLNKIFNINKYVTTPSVQYQKNKALLNIILNLPNVSQVSPNVIEVSDDDLPF